MLRQLSPIQEFLSMMSVCTWSCLSRAAAVSPPWPAPKSESYISNPHTGTTLSNRHSSIIRTFGSWCAFVVMLDIYLALPIRIHILGFMTCGLRAWIRSSCPLSSPRFVRSVKAFQLPPSSGSGTSRTKPRPRPQHVSTRKKAWRTLGPPRSATCGAL